MYIIDVLSELRDLTNKLVVKVVLLEEENEQLKDEKKQLKNKTSKIEKKNFLYWKVITTSCLQVS